MREEDFFLSILPIRNGGQSRDVLYEPSFIFYLLKAKDFIQRLTRF